MTGLSRRDRALALAALLGVAVLVGMAVRPAPATTTDAVPAQPLILLLQTGIWLVLAADILVTAGIVYALATDRRWLTQQRAKRPWTMTLASYIAALMPTLLASLLILFMRRSNGARGALLQGLGAPASGRPGLMSNLAGAPSSSVTWASLALAALLVVLFLGWLFWPAPRRAPVTPVVIPRPPDAASQAVDDSLDALLAISDPRRAIIAAYSSMERSMSRVGVPRRVSEAPVEFVVRALRSFVGVSADLNRLTDLFELAKFSHHAIDDEMRTSAIAALTAIRARLVAPSPSTA